MRIQNKKKSTNRHRSIRLPDSLWAELQKRKSDKEPTASDVIRNILWEKVGVKK